MATAFTLGSTIISLFSSSIVTSLVRFMSFIVECVNKPHLAPVLTNFCSSTHLISCNSSTSSRQSCGCNAGPNLSQIAEIIRPGLCITYPKIAPSVRSSTRRFSVPSTRIHGRNRRSIVSIYMES